MMQGFLSIVLAATTLVRGGAKSGSGGTSQATQHRLIMGDDIGLWNSAPTTAA